LPHQEKCEVSWPGQITGSKKYGIQQSIVRNTVKMENLRVLASSWLSMNSWKFFVTFPTLPLAKFIILLDVWDFLLLSWKGLSLRKTKEALRLK
jgi:hypothetical protein